MKYEIIWRFTCSGDEAAKDILDAMKMAAVIAANTMDIPEEDWPTVKLVKVMDDER